MAAALDRIWPRVVVAVLYVGLWTVPYYVFASTNDAGTNSGSETTLLVVLAGLTLLTGFIVRSPALLLPAVIYFALVPLGVDPQDSDGWTYAGLYLVPAGFLSFFALAAGWLGRVGFDWWRARSGTTEPATR
jgi:hypothetical protein